MLSARLRFLYLLVGWLVVSLVLLAAFGSLNFDLFYVSSLIGFLVVTELTAPLNRIQQWRSGLGVIAVLGFVGFAYLVVTRIQAILAVPT
jgi:uncharacterized membrane protein (Fun14 family)